MTRRPDHAENPPAERACLAGLLMAIDARPAAVGEVAAGLEPGAFADPVHSEIMSCIREALAADRPGIRAVQAAARRRVIVTGEDHHDVIVRVADLCEREYVGAAPVENARLAAHEVRQAHGQRQALGAMTAGLEAIRGARDASGIGEVIERLEAIRGQAEPAVATPHVTALDAIDQWCRHEATPAVPTGFSWFDGPTDGGFPIGGLVVIGAPPSVGKSALCLQLAVGALVTDSSLPVVWGAGEMALHGIGRRLVTVASGIIDGCPHVTMRDTGRRTPAAREAGRRIAEVIGDRLEFVEPPLSVAAIDAAVVRSGAKLAVIDYLQLMRIEGGGKDRVADLDRLIGEVKDLAIRRDIAVVAVSSVAKAAGAGGNAAQAFRGSGEIGFACELGYVAEREERDGRPVIADDGTVGIVWRNVKPRNTGPRDLALRFDGLRQTYHGPDHVDEFEELGAGAFTGGFA